MKSQINTTVVVIIVVVVIVVFMLLYIGLSSTGGDLIDSLRRILTGV